MATGKEDCGLLMTALIPSGKVADAQRAMAEAAPEGTVFACEYVDLSSFHEPDDMLLKFKSCGLATVRGLAGRQDGEG